MKREDVLELFQNISVWKRGSQRAPHKPLLILYALGKYNRGEDRLLPYTEVDSYLRNLLLEFGPPRKSIHTEYPFWRLQNDKVWVLENKEQLKRRKSNTEPLKSELVKYNIPGGFTEPIYELLCKDKSLVRAVATIVLENNFPNSMHEDLLNAVGLDISEAVSSERAKRDPTFRERVMRAYEYSCTVCGFDLRLGNANVGLEAAHIKWHQAGGPDTEDNGFALCILHHKLFDRGAFTISAGYQVFVSQKAYGSHGMDEWLLRFHGQEIRDPQSPAYLANQKYLKWHQAEVFKGPARFVG